MLRSFLGVGVALLLGVPAAEAAPVALRDDLAATHVALAGADVLVTRELRDGRVELDAIALENGARRTVLSLPSASGLPGDTVLAASPQRVGIIVPMRGRTGNEFEWRVYSGPPSGPLELVLRTPNLGRGTWIPLLLDVDGDRLLLVEWRDRGRRMRARTLEPGAGLVTLPWVGSRLVPVAIAGQYAAAFVGEPTRRWRTARVALVDRLTGAEQSALPPGPPNAPAPEDVDVAPSGQMVAQLGDALSITGPGAPPQVIPGTQSLDRPRFSGAGIAAVDTARFVHQPVVVTADGTRRPLSNPTGWVRDLTADERGVAWLANGCIRYAAVAGMPPVGPPSDPCPTTEIGLYLDNDSGLRGRTVRVKVLCVDAPKGVCRGTVLLRYRGRIVGSGDFAIPAGKRPKVEARLTRSGLRLVRRRDPILRIGARMSNGRIGQSRGVAALRVHVR